ncbi:ribonuclease E/G [Jeotgalibacillus aurantiacus]|uniref:ribonuclease E/G n=1 Tax=Jeotgalibacillus aurantiacus TaxID=2763266 RepID=UPI001D0B64BF|nr:ribonuclease E/G [Jeotgalibacillus aurantiacus]
MLKRLLISTRTTEKKWALLYDHKPEKIALYPAFRQTKIGNVYSGYVTSVKASLNAAFVSFDRGVNGYLSLKDVPGGKIHQGQRILVQVKKDEEGTKGPVLTANLECQGKWLVYFPYGETVHLSKKITDRTVRQNLTNWAKTSLIGTEGLLVRTEAQVAPVQELLEELTSLRSTVRGWEQSFSSGKGEFIIEEETLYLKELIELIKKENPDEIVSDDSEVAVRLKKLTDKEIELYLSDADLFSSFINDDVHELMTKRHVWLDGGSSIVIDSLEALTVIDVNSGKNAGQKEQQRAIMSINRKAAAEVMRQIRLRDLHGIMIIDFINLKSERDKQEIEQLLKKEAEKDDKHVHFAGYTELNLYQLTRKKTRPSYESVYLVPCKACGGSGKVRSVETVLLEMEKELLEKRRTLDKAVIYLTADLHEGMQKDPSFITWIRDQLNIDVTFKEMSHSHPYYEIMQ